MNNLIAYSESVFDNIKHNDENGIEFWYARELSSILEYNDWRNFLNVIKKAKTACEMSDEEVLDHFVDVTNMVKLGSGSTREVDDIKLSRYACYLIVQNGDPRKETIAIGQSYFAIQTRKQEIEEKEINELNEISECEKRIAIRNELKKHNKSLVSAAKNAGVETNQEYATFQNSGYQGLYGGMTAQDIKNHKNLKKSHNILDYMGSTELAANLFRATQTEEKLRRENIKGKENANKTHFEVGRKVRKTIKELGGTMPEDLETPKESIKQVERKVSSRKKLKN